MLKCNGKRSSLTIEEIEPSMFASRDVLTEILRAGARKLLAEAIEAEVEQWIAERAERVDAAGHREVVRNGHLPARSVLTGIGPVEVTAPRVHDRRPGAQREKFSSAILPRYVRKAPSVENVLPWLYLKGISSGAFGEALEALVGPSAAGLSASTICRLKQQWLQEYPGWSGRSLEGKHYVYVWADGIHFTIRLADPGKARQMIQAIWMAETKAAAEAALERFVQTFAAKYPKAVECLSKDRDVLLTFYDFPAEHWASIRTTNPIESTLATVRLRTDKTKGCGTRLACLTMVFKLCQSAEKNWRALNGSQRVAELIAGATFVDGVKQVAA